MTALSRRGAAVVLLLAGAAAIGARTRPATTVELIMATADTLPAINPTIVIRGVDIASTDAPLTLGLQIATTPGFTNPLLVDTTVMGDSVEIALPRPLPSRARLHFRATARTTPGALLISPTETRVVPPWLVLVSPNEPNGSTLETPRPTFTWRGGAVGEPPGPWHYDLEIRNVGSGRVTRFDNLSDTTFMPPLPLDLNTSYRWSVRGRLRSGDEVLVSSQSSFVILDPDVPLATLLYQNFPNPFPTATSPVTCVWFDLANDSFVRLDVSDLRGRPVRTLIPTSTNAGFFVAGRHGRSPAGGTGCNGTIQWDGRGADGRFVPAGVYLLRLRGRGIDAIKSVVFRGPS